MAWKLKDLGIRRETTLNWGPDATASVVTAASGPAAVSS